MANWAVLFFIPFLMIAYGNFRVFIYRYTTKKYSSYAPLMGAIFFFLGTMGVEKQYLKVIWFLVFLDIGTIFTIISLPFLFKEFFVNSRFCRYRVYQNDTQILTLYKFKDSQTFNWQYTAKIEPSKTPILAEFGGDWQINHQQLQLMCDHEILAIARIEGNKVIFTTTREYYSFLHHECLEWNE